MLQAGVILSNDATLMVENDYAIRARYHSISPVET
jgi:hypothetical protein